MLVFMARMPTYMTYLSIFFLKFRPSLKPQKRIERKVIASATWRLG